MLTAVLFLVLALVVFVAATVVAIVIIALVGARRGVRGSGTPDAAVTSFIRRRNRQLGLGSSTPPGDGQRASQGEPTT